jgi:predicted transcriptional regulator
MTGRELILYILANHLEDKPVFEKGKFIGFVTTSDVAKAANVGLATVHAWMHQGRLESVVVNEGIYIPANYVSPLKSITE